MKLKFILILALCGFVGVASADYSDGWDAYKNENYFPIDNSNLIFNKCKFSKKA